MKTIIANILYYLGFKPNCSEFIDEDSITMGYGKLDDISLFEYECSDKLIEKNFWNIILERVYKKTTS